MPKKLTKISEFGKTIGKTEFYKKGEKWPNYRSTIELIEFSSSLWRIWKNVENACVKYTITMTSNAG